MRSDYKDWLRAQEYADNTIAAQLHRVGKVESAYGSLDDLIASGRYDDLIGELSYSVQDERSGRPNPSRISFEGDIRSNLQSYRNAVVRYRKFLLEEDSAPEGVANALTGPQVLEADIPSEKQRLSLERDMQAALRREIHLLDNGLRIIDDGAERAVNSGFIDILCRDAGGRIVVVELKAGKTDARVVGQVLGYMGDLMDEDQLADVRGIVVAHDFDRRTIAAARAVPGLSLVRYSVSFKFEPQV